MRPFPQLPPELRQVEVASLVHAPILESRTLHWPAEADCAASASALAQQPLLQDAYIELLGPLGAGKTTFARHLLRALGVDGRIKSPSYAVLEPYRVGALAISHLDFYRFGDPREWVDAGLRDIFAAPGLKLAEWPENAAGQLPTPDLRLVLQPEGEDRRRVRADALTPRGRQLLAAWPA